MFIILPAIRLLSLAAFALAVYLAWQKALPGCGTGSGCDAVMGSRWARLWKMPVAALGAAIYGAILLISVMISAYDPPQRRRGRWTALLMLGIVAAGAATWLIVVQVFILRRFCAYCMVDHLLGLSTAALIIYALRQGQSAADRPLPVARTAAASAAVVGTFILAHVLIVPRMHRIQTSQELATQQTRPAASRQATASPKPKTVAAVTQPAGRRVTAIRGVVAIDLAQWPVVGSPDAPHVVLDLFDYTCPHCRELHKMMQRARARYGTQLAVVVIPVPLNATCNVAIRKTPERHKDACTLATYALAVWKANPMKFLEYDYWLFDPEMPPSTLWAKEHAELLVGKDEFAQALADPSVEQRIYDGVDIYRNVGAGPIPKLIFPDAVVTWPITSEKYLYEILESQLGVKARGSAPADE